MSEAPRVKNHCNECRRDTWHDVTACYVNLLGNPESYDESQHYQLVKCCGCDCVSFRFEFHSEELRMIRSEHYRNKDASSLFEVINYPKRMQYCKTIEQDYLIPESVRDIYREVLICLQEDMNILAGLGLRACIESVCKELKLNGYNLDENINALAMQGYISKQDARHLHAIRFMGNDAAHQIKAADSASLHIAFSIVEHLLNSVFILPERSKGYLDVTIDAYEPFELLLESHLSNFEMDIEYPLSALLEKDRRRVQHQLLSFEAKLIENIKIGSFVKLRLGKQETIKKNQQDKQLQYYLLQKQEENVVDDDEIPF